MGSPGPRKKNKRMRNRNRKNHHRNVTEKGHQRIGIRALSNIGKQRLGQRGSRARQRSRTLA